MKQDLLINMWFAWVNFIRTLWKMKYKLLGPNPPLPNDWPTVTYQSSFSSSSNMLTMVLIAQSHSQDTCGIGSSPFPALEWPEDRFGIDWVEMRWSPHNRLDFDHVLLSHLPKLSLSLVDSSPNCPHKLISALDGWYSARKPFACYWLTIAITLLPSHCHRCHHIVIVPLLSSLLWMSLSLLSSSPSQSRSTSPSSLLPSVPSSLPSASLLSLSLSTSSLSTSLFCCRCDLLLGGQSKE